jgi:hypothetical protein
VTVTRTADYAASILPRLLRFELLDLPICPVDLSLLCRHLLLQILFLLLPRLHLIADQGAAMAGINTVPKLGGGRYLDKASQALSRFLCAANYSPGLQCMMPPSAKTVVAVM